MLTSPHPRVDVLGVGISAVAPHSAVEEISRWIRTGERSYVCVTAVHVGLKSQAPGRVQQRGLEWAYRPAKEPRRLCRRYLRNNPSYLARIALRPPRLTTTEGALS
ncbi:WecB/TagA/CpsF family glycosyltransferase [Streptomyces sp. NPDC101165]|uniref:WecB/TagA/CpsF family glycosyltransferase n=1 Tax=Streptomyces sp. NPDC101165 TaxID=3366119 RepID=UPI003804FDD8